MKTFLLFIDRLSEWTGKAFAWCILILAFATTYEVFVRYVLRAPTSWAFDVSYIMYGTLFMMAGAYALSRNAHVRGDFLYRLWPPRVQAAVEFVLYFVFFFPGMLALVYAGIDYAAESWGFRPYGPTGPLGEISINSPAGVPVSPLKTILPKPSAASNACGPVSGRSGSTMWRNWKRKSYENAAKKRLRWPPSRAASQRRKRYD
jgi:TRAP-type mannitol/chloroaromatic compound transport system permease small subunit